MRLSDLNWFAILCALTVAVCWGLYGPALSLARAPNREWGPYKAYIFIGVAYLIIGVIGGAIMMKATGDNFDYTGQYYPAMKWGFWAGMLGAIGALVLTYALTKAGGKPAYVMPIVFGGAVTVNALTAFANLHAGDKVSPLMWVGMFFVAIGICMTAAYTPHGHAPKPGATTPADTTPAKLSGVEATADSSHELPPSQSTPT